MQNSQQLYKLKIKKLLFFRHSQANTNVKIVAHLLYYSSINIFMLTWENLMKARDTIFRPETNVNELLHFMMLLYQILNNHLIVATAYKCSTRVLLLLLK